MTKSELVAKLALKNDITKAQADRVLSTLVELVIDEIKNMGGITLAGLGNFIIVKREARKGHNPKTLAPIEIPASKSVKFKSAKALKDAIN